MTNEYEIADDNRESLIWTKEQLLAPLQAGMEQPPHPMRLGRTERDYYLLGRAGVSGRAGEPARGAGEPAKAAGEPASNAPAAGPAEESSTAPGGRPAAAGQAQPNGRPQ
jgi:hypothetical protein